MSSESVIITRLEQGKIWLLEINRPNVRNAVDQATGQALAASLIEFDRVRPLPPGPGPDLIEGFDLRAVPDVATTSSPDRLKTARPKLDFDTNEVGAVYDTRGPMGVSRLQLAKPTVAAVEGFAVVGPSPQLIGGLELALWCDLRVAAEDAQFGVFCRRWGVPLIDGGTFRLPRLIGQSRALDMILTGRPVSGQEALQFGLANRIVPSGPALDGALNLARSLTAFPQKTMHSDRMASITSWSKSTRQALINEFEFGLQADDFREGASRFVGGAGRGGSFSLFNAKL